MARALSFLLLLIGATGCSVMKADGNLKQLSDGTLFSSQPSKPIPADNTSLPSRDETDVSWKIQF